MKRVLAIAAHADDEILGCGGTLAKHAEAGDQVTIFILSKERYENAFAAAGIIGASVWNSDLKDQEFDMYPILEITQAIETCLGMFKPDTVYTHWIGDLNKDHEIAARATLTACRPLPHSTVRAIYGYEIPSSTEWGVIPFAPAHYEEISLQVTKKISALKKYGDEIKPKPHARSFTAIAAQMLKRGAECGVENAEAFHVYKTIKMEIEN